MQGFYPGAKVHAIEMMPDYMPRLQRNARANGFVAHEYAIFSKACPGGVLYNIAGADGLNSVLKRSPGSALDESVLHVDCVTIADLIADGVLPDRFDVVKIDCEGATMDVLEGFGDFLQQVKVLQIETETYAFWEGQRLQRDVFAFLKSVPLSFEIVHHQQASVGQFDSIFAGPSCF